jgi:mannan endo-1,4-beta-mannosidase
MLYKTIGTYLLLLILFACKKNESSIANSADYHIDGKTLYKGNDAIQLVGANAFHVFGPGSSDMNAWQLDIVREFIGNVKETPVSGNTIKDGNGAYLHAMQTVVDSNRLNKRITIFCAFGWDGTSANAFTGLRPSLTTWWNDYQIRLKQWATQFKGQTDVWLEVWNEPYRFDRTDGYTDAIWLTDMDTLVSIVRSTGNQNIILVPCAEQGQDESVLLNMGNKLLSNNSNILFDIHAYEKWLLDNSTNIGKRLQALQNMPIFFGEVAPLNASVLMNPKPFLDSVFNRGLSVSAWVWKYDNTDVDALLNTNGQPNNLNNNNWGINFKNLSLQPRKP